MGVNPIPRKTCNYSCVYCQLGRTPRLSAQRGRYYHTEDVVEAVREAVRSYGRSIDYVTFMGDGEPTLAENLGEMAEGVREFWKGGMALITNGSLFHLSEVRALSRNFDVISPTVSVGDERTFRRLHRPARSITFSLVAEGSRLLRREYGGQIWAEVMLVRGVNDSLPSLLSTRRLLHELSPDRTFIGVPTRPPAEAWVLPPCKETLRQVFEVFPEAVDMTEPEGPFIRNVGEREDELVEIAKNHPLREDQALAMLSLALGEDEARDSLARMVQQGRLERTTCSGGVFYLYPTREKGRTRSGHS